MPTIYPLGRARQVIGWEGPAERAGRPEGFINMTTERRLASFAVYVLAVCGDETDLVESWFRVLDAMKLSGAAARPA
jgi:hypothetical protein